MEAPIVSGQQKFKTQASAGKIMLILGCQWPYIGGLPGKGSNCD
jgi:hypothetical protein